MERKQEKGRGKEREEFCVTVTFVIGKTLSLVWYGLR